MVNVAQCKQIIQQTLSASGRGGFFTGTVAAVLPLAINLESGLQLSAADIYSTDSCIGLSVNLKHRHGGGSSDGLQDNVVLRRPLQVGDGVLLISRPESLDGTKYILLDRIQPYATMRGVSAL